MKADVTVDAFPGEKFDGRIAHVAPVLDPATRTAQIEIEVQNANFRLKPGMYAKVDFVVERRENTLVVPANAIVDLDGKKGVFLPGRRRRRAVQAGHRRHVATGRRRSRGRPARRARASSPPAQRRCEKATASSCSDRENAEDAAVVVVPEPGAALPAGTAALPPAARARQARAQAKTPAVAAGVRRLVRRQVSRQQRAAKRFQEQA